MILVMSILSANFPLGQFDPTVLLCVPLAVYALGNGITSWKMSMLMTSRQCLRMLFLFGRRRVGPAVRGLQFTVVTQRLRLELSE